MILGYEDFQIIGAMLAPLYATQAFNTIKLWKVRGEQKHCVYCQKSKKLFEQEIEG